MNNEAVNDNNERGSFSGGLVVGFLAGAVGYFLTQTSEGKEMREKFSGHFHDLRKSMISDGLLSENEEDIADYIRAVRSKIGNYLGEFGQDTDASKKGVKKKTTKRKKKLFKGI
jgi:gas vesicle protein